MGTVDRKAREFERRGSEILAAALALFASDDWQAVTVDQIAEHAEVSKGTIYKHFASKNEIYARLAIDFERRTLLKVRSLDSRLPVLDRLRALMRFAWDTQLSSKELHRVYLYCSRPDFRASLAPEVLAEMQDIDIEIRKPVHELMLAGMAQGVFPRKPVELLVFGLSAALWGGIQVVWSGCLGEIDRERYFEALADFIVAGLVHQGRSAGRGAATARDAA
jgi:AcrR family transcriptional regulator